MNTYVLEEPSTSIYSGERDKLELEVSHFLNIGSHLWNYTVILDENNLDTIIRLSNPIWNFGTPLCGVCLEEHSLDADAHENLKYLI
jgi:hypothetical protein